MKKLILLCVGIVLIIGIGVVAMKSFKTPNDTPTVTTNSSTSEQPQPKDNEPQFDSSAYSLDDPASIWVVVNKLRPINPQNHVPDDLVIPNVSLRIPGAEQMQMRQEAAEALERMFAAAAQDGQQLQITTAFRGYNYQNMLYTGYVRTQGQAVADTQSARPGYSEHQTGLVADIRSSTSPNQCYLEQCFGEMPEGKWLAAHARDYGFIIRYPQGKDDITGYSYEPWHFRYVGAELAAEMHIRDIATLEEFFELGAAPDYAR